MESGIRKMQLEDVLRQFQIPEEILDIKPYGNGHIHGTYRVKAKDGAGTPSYILQQINTHIFQNPEQLMENIYQVTACLQKKVHTNVNRRVLRLIPTRDGKWCCVDERNRTWRMFWFIEDSVCYEQADTSKIFEQSGYAFGEFQFLLADFPVEKLSETIPDFHNTPKRYAKLIEAAKQDVCGRKQEVSAELAFLQEREADCHYFMKLVEAGKMPVRVTHNDTKLNNVLFDKRSQEVLCVIDLDTVMPGLVAFDFGDAIRFGASTGAEDEKNLEKIFCSLELFEAYLKGFLRGTQGSLTVEEVQTLPMGAKVMTLESAIRFLTDYLEGDVYFKTQYEGQNLDRCRTQIKLMTDMEKKWTQIQEIVKKYMK